MKTSIIIPARNEANSLKNLLPDIINYHPDAEIIVVNDGSEDNTSDICNELDIITVNHPYQKGNGASIKSGVNKSTGDTLVFLDADGQHSPKDIRALIEELSHGYDMVVGSRSFKLHASLSRGIANRVYNWFASWITGHKIPDLTSGFRAVKADKFKEFLSILPNGFSYPTTITMAFFRVGYSVNFIPININKRKGDSHIKPIQDGIKFLLIIFRVGVLYSPLKIFFPASLLLFLTGFGYYMYTFITQGRFTNMGILLFIVSVLIFLIGLVSEQITFLIYSQNQRK